MPGTIRIIDILLAVKVGDEDVPRLELQEIENELFQRFEPVVGEITGLLTESDVRHLSAGMSPTRRWHSCSSRTRGRARSVTPSRPRTVASLMFERIPRPVVQELIAEREQLLAEAASA